MVYAPGKAAFDGDQACLFRRTKTANGSDGKSYYTYRLVENQREDTKIRQKTVLNLGSNRDVRQWLSSRIVGMDPLL